MANLTTNTVTKTKLLTVLQKIVRKDKTAFKDSVDPYENFIPLISQIAGGDQAAFAQLYDTTSGLIYGLLLRILRDSETAEEVLVDVYAEIWQEAVRFDAEREKPFLWLIGIAHRRGIERLNLDRKLVSEKSNEKGYPPADQTDSIASERQSLTCPVIESLPATQLEALELAYYSGMKESEIANHLGQPVKTVRENLYLAMKNLRTLLNRASFSPR
jgi:RNA polymerase sigma-70 factor (ECF subfamily)